MQMLTKICKKPESSLFFSYDDQPLREVVQEVNRTRPGQVGTGVREEESTTLRFSVVETKMICVSQLPICRIRYLHRLELLGK